MIRRCIVLAALSAFCSLPACATKSTDVDVNDMRMSVPTVESFRDVTRVEATLEHPSGPVTLTDDEALFVVTDRREEKLVAGDKPGVYRASWEAATVGAVSIQLRRGATVLRTWEGTVPQPFEIVEHTDPVSLAAPIVDVNTSPAWTCGEGEHCATSILFEGRCVRKDRARMVTSGDAKRVLLDMFETELVGAGCEVTMRWTREHVPGENGIYGMQSRTVDKRVVVADQASAKGH
jgi:hypothetical protein